MEFLEKFQRQMGLIEKRFQICTLGDKTHLLR